MSIMCHACCGLVCVMCGMLCNVYCVTCACYIYWLCCMLHVSYRLTVCVSCVLNTVCHTSALDISDVYCVVLIYSVHIMGIAYILWEEWCVFCEGWAPHALCVTYMLHIQGIGCICCTLHVTHMLHEYAAWIGCYWYYAFFIPYVICIMCGVYYMCCIWSIACYMTIVYIVCWFCVVLCMLVCYMLLVLHVLYVKHCRFHNCFMSILCEFCTMCCACCVLYGSYVKHRLCVHWMWVMYSMCVEYTSSMLHTLFVLCV